MYSTQIKKIEERRQLKKYHLYQRFLNPYETWIYVSSFPTQKLELVSPTNFNTHTNRQVFIWQSPLQFSKQKYMPISRSKVMPKHRVYLKIPTLCLAFPLLVTPSLA